jgi:hypothetical protein
MDAIPGVAGADQNQRTQPSSSRATERSRIAEIRLRAKADPSGRRSLYCTLRRRSSALQRVGRPKRVHPPSPFAITDA